MYLLSVCKLLFYLLSSQDGKVYKNHRKDQEDNQCLTDFTTMNSNVYFVLLLVLSVTIPTLSLEYSGDREDATTDVYGKFVI